MSDELKEGIPVEILSTTSYTLEKYIGKTGIIDHIRRDYPYRKMYPIAVIFPFDGRKYVCFREKELKIIKP